MADNNYLKNTNGIGSSTVVNFPAVVLQGDIAPNNSNVTKVDSTDAAVIIVGANSSRRGLYIKNDASCPLFIKFGNTPTSISYTDWVGAGATWYMPGNIYTGLVTGFWESPLGVSQLAQPGVINGSAMVTELYTK